MIDYFFLFSNSAAAQADSSVGQFWIALSSVWDTSTTFPGIKVNTPAALVNGISPLTGFWIVVSRTAPDPNLDANAAMVMKLARDAAIRSSNFVLAAAISGTNRTNLSFSPVPHGSRYPIPLGQ